MFKIFFYINELNDIQKENLNQLRNVNIIYRNYGGNNYYQNAIKINRYCKKKNFKLFVSNDKQLAIRLGSCGLYLPSFNNRDYFAQSNINYYHGHLIMVLRDNEDQIACNQINGDINNSGFLNVTDIVLLIDVILNESFGELDICSKIASDYSFNGQINITDIIGLINYILD